MKSKKEKTKIPLIYGWSSPEEVAQEVWCSIHNSLLRGILLFAIKSSSYNMVIVKMKENDYGVGMMINNGYTMLLPHVPKDYVSNEVPKELLSLKTDKKIIEDFKLILEDI